MAGIDNEKFFGTQLNVGTFPNTSNADISAQFDRDAAAVYLSIRNDSAVTDSDSVIEARINDSADAQAYMRVRAGDEFSYSVGMLGDVTEPNLLFTYQEDGEAEPNSSFKFVDFVPENGTFQFTTPAELMFQTRMATQNLTCIGNTDLSSAAGTGCNFINQATSDAHVRGTFRSMGLGDCYIMYDVEFGAAPGSRSWKVGGVAATGDLEFRNFVNAGQPEIQGTLRQRIFQSGEVTFPTTPSFLAQTNPGAAQNNVTGAGAFYTVLYPDEIYDVGSNYSSPTFTAPVTGKYLFFWNTGISDIGSSATVILSGIETSNRDYNTVELGAGARTSFDSLTFSGSIIADMDAADTAHILVIVFGMAGNTVDIGVTSTNNNRFGGFLLG